jgi:hypothetical protein
VVVVVPREEAINFSTLCANTSSLETIVALYICRFLLVQYRLNVVVPDCGPNIACLSILLAELTQCVSSVLAAVLQRYINLHSGAAPQTPVAPWLRLFRHDPG